MSTDKKSIPQFTDTIVELRQSVKDCLEHDRFAAVETHIRAHDARVAGTEGKTLGWILDEAFTRSDEELAGNTRQVATAVKLFGAIAFALELKDRRQAVRDHQYFLSLWGRVLEIVDSQLDPMEDAAYRRDLTWALSQAEETLTDVDVKIPLVIAAGDEVVEWLEAGWSGALDDGSFPQRKLQEYAGLDGEGRRDLVMNGQERVAMEKALQIFFMVAARSGQAVLEGDLAEDWEGVYGPLPRLYGFTAPAAPRGRGRSAKKAEKSERDKEIRAAMQQPKGSKSQPGRR